MFLFRSRKNNIELTPPLIKENSLQAQNGPQVTPPFEHVSEKTLVQSIHSKMDMFLFRGRKNNIELTPPLIKEISLQAKNGPQVTPPFEHVSEKTLVQSSHDRKYKVWSYIMINEEIS